ncbi:MAG TPA: N-glycosylase/DNA lyase [Spirochaetes bacterium]|nr:N-glycosylase/DNA lyase [Spirochaetota bacterium]
MHSKNLTPIEEIMAVYKKIKTRIIDRLEEFNALWRNGSDEDIFQELVFCILTPSSRARSAEKAVKNLLQKNLLFKGTLSQIAGELNIVRFRNNKAKYIDLARKLFVMGGRINLREKISAHASVYDKREWFVSNVKGIGYKESGHFLRNIGFGDDIAILDRHILKNLDACCVIDEIPGSLSRKKYLNIEKKMAGFSESLEIPLSHLDFVLWYKETGDIFK